MNELREIPDEPGYFAGDGGEIVSIRKTGRPRVLRGTVDKRGYRWVKIMDDKRGCSYPRRVHQLVCAAFHGPRPSEAHLCRHLDDDRSNNSPSNLSWGTAQDNSDDAVRNGKRPMGSSHPRAILDEGAVRQIRQRHSEGVSLRALAGEFGVAKSTITSAVGGRNWSHVGGGAH